MQLSTPQKILAATSGGVALAVGALAVAAGREKVSRRGWLVANVLVPALYGKRGGGLDVFYQRIAQDRANGPALPSAKIQSNYVFTDVTIAGIRSFRLRSKDVPSPGKRILYLHGGAYVFDLMASQWPIVTGLVDRTDAEVVAPIYPLAPEHQAEAGLASVEAVYRSLVDEVGAGNIVIAGDSAGGGLALALAHRLREAKVAAPGALILYFPWLDASVSGPEQPDLERIDPVLSIDQLREAGRKWSGDQADDHRASPLFADHAGLPPVLVLVGTKDLLLSDARRFSASHHAAVLQEFPGMFHGFVCAPIPEAKRALDESAAFIAASIG
ncbi:alpha/beta hydrolase fold domain-containing protein [Sphingomonas sp. NFX23]|uniref:alpha/beta hydrolase fold domain-containing protein n=1 Tax=Sphingomonas sp. NFX23 TaxID=2819532 RepID=UPI003CED1865